MFSTIKSKIILITLSMSLALMFVLTFFSIVVYAYAKEGIFRISNYSITIFAQDVNKDITEIENNALDLALLGSTYYSFNKNAKSMEYAIPQIFKNYSISLGGGIWFEPYMNNPSKRLSCLYVYRKNNKLIIDDKFEGEAYNYPNQNWYKEIISQIGNKGAVHWSLPYKEKIGSGEFMVTAGAGIYDQSNNLVGISTVDWEISSVMDTISKIKPTRNSFALFADLENDYVFVSTDKYLKSEQVIGKSLRNIPWFSRNLEQNNRFKYHGKNYISYFRKLDNGMVLIVNIPEVELFYMTFMHILILCFLLMITISVLSLFLYWVLRKNISVPIYKLTALARKISRGNLNTEIKIENPKEFAELADTFDKMAKNIAKIAKEQEHTESELSIASKIQMSSLPNTFPPFPDNKEFDIYASTVPAKEVGGDFYDYYFIDDEHFLFLVADVAGKGVPAALFMMNVKTLINNISQLRLSPKEMIETINRKVCQSKQNLFVTMFVGIVNIHTGELVCINCGHNPPLIKQNDEFKYLKIDTNTVLGAFEDVEFNVYETELNNGDELFLYTDGVTEALSSSQEMYGEERLLDSVNGVIESDDLRRFVSVVKSDLQIFTRNVSQTDDITMLIFKFNSKHEDIYEGIASTENYKDFHSWVKASCKLFGLDKDATMKAEVICEEIFVNIASYAYPDKNDGKVQIEISKKSNKVTIKFVDWGVKYNPLNKEDPDIDAPLENRSAGGLGVFMVKVYADKCTYKHTDGKNVLTITIKI